MVHFFSGVVVVHFFSDGVAVVHFFFGDVVHFFSVVVVSVVVHGFVSYTP